MISANLRTKLYLDHVVLTVRDIHRTKEFYEKIFGEPDYEADEGFMYHMGPTRLFFTLPRGPQAPNDRFDPTRIGLEHIAIGVKNLDDLKAYAKALDERGIKHSGIHIDNHRMTRTRSALNFISGQAVVQIMQQPDLSRSVV